VSYRFSGHSEAVDYPLSWYVGSILESEQLHQRTAKHVVPTGGWKAICKLQSGRNNRRALGYLLYTITGSRKVTTAENSQPLGNRHIKCRRLQIANSIWKGLLLFCKDSPSWSAISSNYSWRTTAFPNKLKIIDH